MSLREPQHTKRREVETLILNDSRFSSTTLRKISRVISKSAMAYVYLSTNELVKPEQPSTMARQEKCVAYA